MTKHKKNLIVIKTLKDLFRERDLVCSLEDQALLTEQVVVVVKSYVDTKLLQKKEKIDEHLQTKLEQPKETEDTHEEN
jgi:hypothetical protein